MVAINFEALCQAPVHHVRLILSIHQYVRRL